MLGKGLKRRKERNIPREEESSGVIIEAQTAGYTKLIADGITDTAATITTITTIIIIIIACRSLLLSLFAQSYQEARL